MNGASDLSRISNCFNGTCSQRVNNVMLHSQHIRFMLHLNTILYRLNSDQKFQFLNTKRFSFEMYS